MNKKFLSAILFGALMVSSTGTFVSCKDYDDDIDELTSRVDGVEGQIKDLEAKINAANWITSVTPATGGFTVAFNDGSSYTITNGKDGEAGAAGTEWTISEDGFWVCNGEKTTVKAVGQDGAQGEPGKDAQPEVKKENGKWYLWNGTEFEEFAGATPATNVPYYYADPTDPNNYVIMVVCDKDGKNEKSVRLPLNEGLAQITVLENNFNIAYSIAKEGTAWPKWEGGSKEKPAKGEYMVALQTLVDEQKKTVANFDAQLASAKKKAASYKQQLEDQTAQIKKLEEEAAAKKKKEEEARKKQEQERKQQQQANQTQTIDTGNGAQQTTGGDPAQVDTGDDAQTTDPGTVDTGNTGKGTDSMNAGAGAVTGGSGVGQQAANYACNFVGNPYKFGGTSLTNGTDCSGFTQAVYAHFGISLPRDSYSQRSCGTEVSYANAQPGDIICYAGHVALYLGNGQIVHASTERTGITYGYATYRTILSVRRVS